MLYINDYLDMARSLILDNSIGDSVSEGSRASAWSSSSLAACAIETLLSVCTLVQIHNSGLEASV